MTSGTMMSDQIHGFNLVDNQGNKLGSVDGVWVDDATSRLEFIGVKTGWLAGKTHLVPAQDARLDEGNRQIAVPFSQDRIKDAPSFSADTELSPQDEDQIYAYYGLSRSTQASPSGYAGTTETTSTIDTTTTGPRATTVDTSTTRSGESDMPTPPRELDVPLAEENLEVGKRQVEAGRVRLRKVVHTEREQVPVELRHEDVRIERVAATGTEVPANAFQEEEIDVPVMREEAVVEKTAHATGRVRVDKDVQTETQRIEGAVRREDVEIDQGQVDQYVQTPDERR